MLSKLAPGFLVAAPALVDPNFRGSVVLLVEHRAQGRGPSRHVLLLGYSGWGPGQLDQELKAGIWIPADLDDRTIFDTPHDQRWNEVLDALGINPAFIVGSRVPEA